MRKDDDMQADAARDLEQETLPPGAAKSFTWFLSRIGSGSLVHQLTHRLSEIGAALNQYYQDFRGEPEAKITITIKVKNKKGVMHVDGTYKVDLPKEPAAGAIFWTDRDNNFTEDNPDQYRLFPRTPGPRAAPSKKACVT